MSDRECDRQRLGDPGQGGQPHQRPGEQQHRERGLDAEHHPAEGLEVGQHQVFDEIAVRREDRVVDGVAGEPLETVAGVLTEVRRAFPRQIVEPQQPN